MFEKIERDRENIKKKKRGESYDNEGFSYLPLLSLKDDSMPRINVSKLSTLNLLVFLEDSFKNGEKHVLNSLDKIKKVLCKREDLFISVLRYLENKKIRDEMFYWAPGYKISNIFSFIVEVLPNFVNHYREYYIEKVVCRKEHYNATSFIKERFSADYERFKLIDNDLILFNHCISSHAWLENGVNKKISKKSIAYLGIKESLDVCEDLAAFLAPSASFVELTVYDKPFLASLCDFDGLLSKDIKVKDWWIRNGMSIEEWESL